MFIPYFMYYKSKINDHKNDYPYLLKYINLIFKN